MLVLSQTIVKYLYTVYIVEINFSMFRRISPLTIHQYLLFCAHPLLADAVAAGYFFIKVIHRESQHQLRENVCRLQINI